MSRRRGGPRRSEIVEDYVRWRNAEQDAAIAAEPWAAPVDAVAAIAVWEPVTVTRWRRTIPEVEPWRAWLHETFDKYWGMAEAIDRGDFDEMRRSLPPPPRTQADYLAEVVPMLSRGDALVLVNDPDEGVVAFLTPDREGNPRSTAELARILGVSPRTVRRYRTD
jgi:hypothetical protein